MHDIEKIYSKLMRIHAPQGWWPVTRPGKAVPEYNVARHSDKQRLEIIFGAILTQNTAWRPNVERAIEKLNRHGLIDIDKIIAIDYAELAGHIRSAGYYNQKAKKLKNVAHFLKEYPIRSLMRMDLPRARALLLGVNGIGPETADSILLYALEKPIFVVDAYTRKIFSHLGFFHENASYDEIQNLFMRELKHDSQLFNEYHALIVEHAKRYYRRGGAESCPLAASLW